MNEDVIAISTRLGPVFTSCGFVGWDLLLLDDRVEAYRLGGWKTLEVHFLLYAGRSIEALLGRWRAGWVDGIAPASARIDMRLYETTALEAITVKRSAGINEVRFVTRAGHTDVFGILQRERTDAFRAAFQTRYPALYREEGFANPSAWRPAAEGERAPGAPGNFRAGPLV
jgi:hypothetical protein